MKQKLSLSVSLTAIAVLLLVNSCTKDFPRGYFNPLIGGCQVVEYHWPQFDQFYPAPLPLLFRKTFDPTGKVVKGMACGFLNDNLPADAAGFLLDMTIAQRDRRVFLIKADSGKMIPPDTLVTIYLNNQGRPDSSIGRPGSCPEAGTLAYEHEYYYYKNDRVTYIKHTIWADADFSFSGKDTVRYDKYDNPISYGFNTYQYDHTRKGGDKFYADVFMGNESNFYILQYLGFFPEINNPPNLRTYEYSSDWSGGGNLTNQQFDREGKLTGFSLVGENVTISWNCP